MSAVPRFWSASRAAARRRVSRRGFFAVAGVHLAAVAGVFLLSAAPTAKKVTVAAGRKDTAAASTVGGAAEPPLTPAERAAVVWMDPATFEAPPAFPEPPADTPPSEPLAPAPSPTVPAPRHAVVREPFLAPTPPRPRRPTPATTAAVPPKKNPPPRSPASPVRVRTTVRPNPSPRPAAADDTAAGSGAAASAGNGSGDNDGPTGAGGTDWYASMLHERFYARWEQPTSVFASAQRYTATLRLRIERDGRVSDFRLVRPSGLVPMDESVLTAAARVTRVDPPPSGLLRGGAYVVNVGFVRE